MRFWEALDTCKLPSVSYLKAPGYQDGHPGYSDPLLEQEFVVETVNRLMRSPDWQTMAIIIAYDDSDGWYDHVMPPVVNESQTAYDFLRARLMILEDNREPTLPSALHQMAIKAAFRSVLGCRSSSSRHSRRKTM